MNLKIKSGGCRSVALAAVLLCCCVGAASAESRVALVIGNGGYSRQALPNPPNDAALVGRSLQRAGFKVTVKTDLTREGMRAAVRDFCQSLSEGDTALFYYAGHGAQADGENYLLPVDAPPGMEEFEAEDRCYKAALVLGAMAQQGTGLNIMILDCCRDNPFARSWRSAGGAGMAEMRAPQETLIAYATAPGKVALDGRGANSPYSTALAEELVRPGTKIQDVFLSVARRVHEATGGDQRPWTSSDLLGEFVFVPETQPTTSLAPASQPSPQPTPQQMAMLALPQPTPKPIQTAPVATSPAQQGNYPGERFPETRTVPLSVQDSQKLSADDLRYAINEMFARYGADFPKEEVKRQFSRFSWYRPRSGLDFDEIESRFFSDLERENLKRLGEALETAGTRKSPSAGQNQWTGRWGNASGYWLEIRKAGAGFALARSGSPPSNLVFLGVSQDGRSLRYKEDNSYIHILTLISSSKLKDQWIELPKNKLWKEGILHKAGSR